MNTITHLGVYGALAKEDCVLLVKKSRGPYSGKLDLPGGKLEHGETAEEGLAREFMEETGVIVLGSRWLNNLTVVTNFSDERGDISMYQVGLLYTITHFDESNLQTEMDEEDSLGAEWYNISKLTSEQLSPFAKIALNK
jgi:8-oxo-dGTP diphosphatase